MADITARAILIDKMTPALKKIDNSFKKTGQKIKGGTEDAKEGFSNLGSAIFSVKGAFVGLSAGGVGLFAKALLSASAEMETLETKFKVLLGNTENAKARMQELSKFAQTTPFQLSEVANASRVLQTLGGSALATGDSLRMVGDASAVSGESFENLAIHVGRAYSGLKSNRPIGESMSRLQELGLVTGETRGEIEKLQKAGKGKDAWKVLEKELGKTKGGMKELSGTFTGLSSTLSDQFQSALRQIASGGFFESIKGGLTSVVETMNKWLDSGIFLRIGASWDYISGGFEMFSILVFNGFQRIAQVGAQAIAGLVSGVNSALKSLPNAIVPDSWLVGLQKAEDSTKAFYKTLEDEADNGMIAATEAADKMNAGWDIMVGNVKAIMPQYTESVTEATKKVEVAVDSQIKKQEEMSAKWDEFLQKNLDRKLAENEADAEMLERNKKVTDANLQAKIDAEAKQKAVHEKGAKDRIDIAKAEKDAQVNLAMSLTSSLSTISQNELGKSKKTAKLRKAIALSEAIVNVGLGVSKALGSAPPPLNFINAGIVASVGASNISNIASQKFARGGIVKGQDGVSDLGDKTMVRVNAGEGVFTKEQMRAMGNQRSISVAPVINIQGNADSSTIQNLREESTNIANKVIESIRNGDLNLVNELNLVTA